MVGWCNWLARVFGVLIYRKARTASLKLSCHDRCIGSSPMPIVFGVVLKWSKRSASKADRGVEPAWVQIPLTPKIK